MENKKHRNIKKELCDPVFALTYKGCYDSDGIIYSPVDHIQRNVLKFQKKDLFYTDCGTLGPWRKGG